MGKNAEILDGCIFTDTFDGDVQLIILVAFYLQSFFLAADVVEVRQFDGTDEAEDGGRRVVAFLIGIENRLDSRAFGCRSLFIGNHLAGNCLCCCSSDVEYAGTAFQ